MADVNRKDYNLPIDREYVKSAFAAFLKNLKENLTGIMGDDENGLDKSIESCFDPETGVLLDDATLIKAINDVSHNGVKFVREPYRDPALETDIYTDISRTYFLDSWVPTIFIAENDYPVKDPASTDPYVVEFYKNSLWIPVTKPEEGGSVIEFVTVLSEDPKRGNIEDIEIKDDEGEAFEQIVPAINQLYKNQLERVDFITTCDFNTWENVYRLSEEMPNHLYVITDDFKWPSQADGKAIQLQYNGPDAKPFNVLRDNRHDLPAVYAYVDSDGYIYDALTEYPGEGTPNIKRRDTALTFTVVAVKPKSTTYKAGSWIYSYDEFTNPDGTPRKSLTWKALNNGGGEDHLYVQVPEKPTDHDAIQTNVMYVWPTDGEDQAHLYIKGDTEADSEWLDLGGEPGINWVGSFTFFRNSRIWDKTTSPITTTEWHNDPEDITSTWYYAVWSDNENMVVKEDKDQLGYPKQDPEGNVYAEIVSATTIDAIKAAVKAELSEDAANTIRENDYVWRMYTYLTQFVWESTKDPSKPGLENGRKPRPGDLVTVYTGIYATPNDKTYVGQYIYKDDVQKWMPYSAISTATYTIEGVTRYADNEEYNDPDKTLIAIDPKHLDMYANNELYKREIVKNILGNTSPDEHSLTREPVVPGLTTFLLNNTTFDPKETYTIEFTDGGTPEVVSGPTLSKYLDYFYDTSAEVNKKLKALRKSKLIERGADFAETYPDDMTASEKENFLGYVLYWTCDTTDADHPQYEVGQMYSYLIDSEGNMEFLGAATVDMEGYVKKTDPKWEWLTGELDMTEDNLETRLQEFVIDGNEPNRAFEKNKIVITDADNKLATFEPCVSRDLYALKNWYNGIADNDPSMNIANSIPLLSNNRKQGLKTVNGNSLIITNPDDPNDKNINITAGLTEVSELPSGTTIDEGAIYRLTSDYLSASGYEDNKTSGIYVTTADKSDWFHLSDNLDEHVIKSFVVENLESLQVTTTNPYLKYPACSGEVKFANLVIDGVTYTNAKGTFRQLVEYIGDTNQIVKASGLIDPAKMANYCITQEINIYEVGGSAITPINLLCRWDGTTWLVYNREYISYINLGNTFVSSGTLTAIQLAKVKNDPTVKLKVGNYILHPECTTTSTRYYSCDYGTSSGNGITHYNLTLTLSSGAWTITSWVTYPPTSSGTSGDVWTSDGSGLGYWTSLKTTILNMFFPVGTIYLSLDRYFNPQSSWGGTWVKIDSGWFLEATTNSSSVNTNHNAGLPNINGDLGMSWPNHGSYATDNFCKAWTWQSYDWPGKWSMGLSGGTTTSGVRYAFRWDAHDGNSAGHELYGNSTTVQPKSVLCYMWKRTA